MVPSTVGSCVFYNFHPYGCKRGDCRFPHRPIGQVFSAQEARALNPLLWLDSSFDKVQLLNFSPGTEPLTSQVTTIQMDTNPSGVLGSLLLQDCSADVAREVLSFLLLRYNLLHTVGGNNLLNLYVAEECATNSRCIVLFVRNRERISAQPRTFSVPPHATYPSLPATLAGVPLRVLDIFDIGDPRRQDLDPYATNWALMINVVEPCDHRATRAAIVLAKSLMKTNSTNFVATSCGHRVRGGNLVRGDYRASASEGIVVFVTFKGLRPLDEPMLPTTFECDGESFLVDVREGFFQSHVLGEGADSFTARDVLSPDQLLAFESTIERQARIDDLSPATEDGRDYESFLSLYDRPRGPLGISGIPIAAPPASDGWHTGTLGFYIKSDERFGYVTNQHVLFGIGTDELVPAISPTPVEIAARKFACESAVNHWRSRAESHPCDRCFSRSAAAEATLERWNRAFPEGQCYRPIAPVRSCSRFAVRPSLLTCNSLPNVRTHTEEHTRTAGSNTASTLHLAGLARSSAWTTYPSVVST